AAEESTSRFEKGEHASNIRCSKRAAALPGIPGMGEPPKRQTVRASTATITNVRRSLSSRAMKGRSRVTKLDRAASARHPDRASPSASGTASSEYLRNSCGQIFIVAHQRAYQLGVWLLSLSETLRQVPHSGTTVGLLDAAARNGVPTAQRQIS